MSSRLQDIAMKRKINGLIKLLSEAADTAPDTIVPTADDFNQKISQAPDDTQIKVPNKDIFFSKSKGNWFVSGAGISSNKLALILSDEGKKKLSFADRKKSQDLDLAPSDFIAPVKAVNFTRGRDGAWSDQTPVDPSIIKKYLFGTTGGDIDVAAVDASGNYFVHQDRDLSYVLTTASFNIMVTDKGGDPLLDMLRLLDRTGLGERYKVQDSVNVSPEIIRVIDEQIELPLMFDNLPQAGNELKDAIGDIRTGFGKFADLFSRDDLKVNFSFKDYGPTFERRLVTGRSGGLAAKDIARMRETGYFKNQALPAMSPGNYKFTDKISAKKGTVASVTTSTVTGISGVTVDNLTLNNTHGSAFYLYLKGYLVYEGEKRQSIEAPPAAPGPTQPNEKTPEDQWEEYVKELLKEGGGDWGWTMSGANGRPGGIFFEFNIADKSDKEIPADYIAATNENIKKIKKDFEKIFEKVDSNQKPTSMGISVLAIATGDPIGSVPQNTVVSNRRVGTLAKQIDKSMGDVLTQPVGETPWQNISAMQSLSAATANNKNKLKGARFGTTIFKRTAATIDPNEIALKFYNAHVGSLDNIKESYRANLINEIRRIIKETK